MALRTFLAVLERARNSRVCGSRWAELVHGARSVSVELLVCLVPVKRGTQRVNGAYQLIKKLLVFVRQHSL